MILGFTLLWLRCGSFSLLEMTVNLLFEFYGKNGVLYKYIPVLCIGAEIIVTDRLGARGGGIPIPFLLRSTDKVAGMCLSGIGTTILHLSLVCAWRPLLFEHPTLAALQPGIHHSGKLLLSSHTYAACL